MLNKLMRTVALALGLAALMPLAAAANEVDTATINAGCTGYTFSATGQHLEANDKYEVNYWFGLQFPNGSVWDVNGSLPVQSSDQNGDFSANLTENWGPAPPGTYSFTYGHATLHDITTGQDWNTIYITFSPPCFTCPGLCTTQTTNQSNFNGTAINGGTYIWFNSNFQATGIPSSGATLYFSNQTISFTANGTNYQLPVPNSQVTFSPSATCTSTTFDTQTGSWNVTVPLKGDDEIFLAGLSYPVPSNFGKVTGNVTWSGDFQSYTSNVGVQWKWGAAVYSQFTQDYNAIMAKAAHQTACGLDGSDHAGTPEGTDSNGVQWKKYVIGGARGGGGSNFTGSWSGTVNNTIKCNKKTRKKH